MLLTVSQRFLLARLHMNSLIGKQNTAAIRKALETLPSEVDKTYDEAMERIEQQASGDIELAKQIFCWITCARRSLNVNELQIALAIEHGTTSIDPETIINEDVLTSVCAGLVVIEGQQKIIRLVRKYLASPG
jgi:ankyrin repeat domain-containing protein 50